MNRELDSIIATGLEQSATIRERVVAIGAIGLAKSDIAVACDVSSSTIYNWLNSYEISRHTDGTKRLDDLRNLAAILLIDKELSRERAAEWMLSRFREPPYKRPVELLSSDPEFVFERAAAIPAAAE